MEKHLVHRQKVVLQIPKRDDAFALQSMVSYLLQNELKISLESALDNAFPPGKVVRIDTLQLNLGDINPHNFEQEFKNRFNAALAESLSAKSDSIANSVDDESIISEAQSATNALIFFLEKGYLPWYSSTVNTADWEADILKMLTKSEYQYLVQWLKETYQQNNAVIDRLILQFSDHLLAAILQNAASFIRQNWQHIFTDFAFILSIFDKGRTTAARKKGQKLPDTLSYFDLNSTEIRNQVWQAAFQVLLNGTSKAHAFSILKLLSAHFGIKGRHITAARAKQINSGLKTAVVKDAFKPWAQFLKIEDGTISTKTKKDNGKDDSEEHIDAAASEEAENDIVINSDTNNPTAKNKADKTTTENDIAGYNRETVNKMDKKEAAKKKKPADDKDIIGTNTSGVVLLAPFFKPYFTRLELINNNRFINDQAQERAVMLLYYLATGRVEAAEFDLVLQKILCGYALEKPLPTSIVLSKKEETCSVELLDSVLNHWEPLKGTSIQGLREAFLIRNGNLELRENGWILKVEQKTLDILLSRLPWGFSTIQQPWMQDILSVDWY